MTPHRDNHAAIGWTSDGQLRWIEIGGIRLTEEEKDGAFLQVVQPSEGPPWLSSTELAALVRHLAGWFAEDPSETIDQIETSAKYVRSELEAWNEKARIDEEHPPYEKLTQSLDALLKRCGDLREDLGKFAAERGDDRG